MDHKLSEHFWASEFVCRCGKCELSNPDVIKLKINMRVVQNLERLRIAINAPIWITSGARCRDKQIQIYKERYKEFWESHIVWSSLHLLDSATDKFNACDFRCDFDMYKTSMIAAHCGFTEVGWYQRKAGEGLENIFVHSGMKDGLSFYRKIYNY